jgi:glycosyltransferase involved in cell wall biosynthesis
MFVSIIIPSYNEAGNIEPCLRSLIDQDYSGPYEIILVDSSGDETPDIVARHFPFVTLIRLEKKTDPGRARMIGIRRARGDIIRFIDADCVADRAWLEKTIGRHREGHPVVGGSVVFGNRAGGAVALAGYLAEFREFIPEQPSGLVDHVPACNVSYRREIFSRQGSFNGRYYPQEDMLFNHQLKAIGLSILFDPEIRVSHAQRTGFSAFLRHQYRIGSVTPAVILKCGLPGAWLSRSPLRALLASPVLPAVKFIRTLLVFLRRRPSAVLAHPGAVALLAAGLGAWIIGFVRGTSESTRIKEPDQ